MIETQRKYHLHKNALEGHSLRATQANQDEDKAEPYRSCNMTNPPNEVPPTQTNEACEIRVVPSGAHAHHIHEFGEVDETRIVHLEVSESSAAEDDVPVAPITVKGGAARSARWKRLYERCVRPRHLMQYFYNETLYRTVGVRKVTTEELFLDLVIVAAIAALGHELRESEINWRSLEKFLLLFGAVVASWRQVVMLWNLWGIHEDVLEKIGIYILFMALTGIALGAHSAFDDLARPYVAVSAFIASALPAIGVVRWASQERLLKNPANRVNEPILLGVVDFISVLPYLAAAFVKSDRATRILYWVSLGLQYGIPIGAYQSFRFLHRNVKGYTRLALNIELFVEKHEVLTMIVLGETMIGLLFEAGGTSMTAYIFFLHQHLTQTCSSIVFFEK